MLFKLLPSIRCYVPEHFTHKLLLFIEVARKLVGMQKETKLSYRLFQLVFIGTVSGTQQGLSLQGLPLCKVLMARNTKRRRKDVMNSRDKNVNRPQHLQTRRLQGPMNQNVVLDGSNDSLSVIIVLGSHLGVLLIDRRRWCTRSVRWRRRTRR